MIESMILCTKDFYCRQVKKWMKSKLSRISMTEATACLKVKGLVFYVLLFLSLYIYAGQVIFGTYLLSYLFYIMMAIALIYPLVDNITKNGFYNLIKSFKAKGSDSEKIAVLLAVYLGLNGLNDLYYGIGYVSYIRILVFYCLPILYFTHLSKVVDVKLSLIILSVSGALVGVETLWEFVRVAPTTFELLNFNYVKALTGNELNQLLGPIRPTGLVEHLHATAFVLSIAFYCATLLFLEGEDIKSKLLYLILAMISFAALVGNGSRLVLVGVIFTWLYLYVTNSEYRKLLRLQMLTCTVAIVALYIVTSDNQLFWQSTYFQYIWKIMVLVLPAHFVDIFAANVNIISGNDSLEIFLSTDKDGGSVFDVSMYQNLTYLNALFGLGFGGANLKLGVASDDFYLLQLLSQLGIIGTALFVALIIMLVKNIRGASKGVEKFYKYEKNLLSYYLIMLPFVTIHSSVLLRKSVWLLFCFSIVVMIKTDNRLNNELRKKNSLLGVS